MFEAHCRIPVLILRSHAEHGVSEEGRRVVLSSTSLETHASALLQRD